MTVNELKGQTFHCSSDEYIVASNGTDICPVTSGDQQLKNLGFEDVDKWLNLVILVGITFSYRVMTYFCLRFIRFGKR
jgi:hypothetical protein